MSQPGRDLRYTETLHPSSSHEGSQPWVRVVTVLVVDHDVDNQTRRRPGDVGGRARVPQPPQHSAIWTVTHFPVTFVWERHIPGARTIASHPAWRPFTAEPATR